MGKDKKPVPYNEAYYKDRTDYAVMSAREVIPLILQYFSPGSVADIGCGMGAWLSVWEQNGVKDIVGIDGSYINPEQLLINKENFLSADLEKALSLSRKFDLVMSLEVAEHIRPEFAAQFIRSLCTLSDVVLFSAAIPHQGGLLHYNEQYPTYWVNLFAKCGFSPYDVLREKIWDNRKVNAYYRQNILLFVNDRLKGNYPSLIKDSKPVRSLVHPDYLEQKEFEIIHYKKALANPFTACWYFIKKYGKKILKPGGK